VRSSRHVRCRGGRGLARGRGATYVQFGEGRVRGPTDGVKGGLKGWWALSGFDHSPQVCLSNGRGAVVGADVAGDVGGVREERERGILGISRIGGAFDVL
jgi:hypothetical protein